VLSGYSGTVTDWMRFTGSGGNTIVEADRDDTGSAYGLENPLTWLGFKKSI